MPNNRRSACHDVGVTTTTTTEQIRIPLLLPLLQIAAAESYLFLLLVPAFFELLAPQRWAAKIPDELFGVVYPVAFVSLLLLGTTTASSRRRLRDGTWGTLAVVGNVVNVAALGVSLIFVGLHYLTLFLLSTTKF